MVRLNRRGPPVVIMAASVALVAGACSAPDGSADPTTSPSARPATFVFGTSAEPVTLDPAFASDRSSLRAARQIFEGLVSRDPSTGAVEPLLATSWKASDGGRTWTFRLRSGVQFTDGSTFDADAVCANFTRWFGFTDPVQQSLAYYFKTVFKAFRDDAAQSLYRSCEAPSEDTAVIRLNTPDAAFLTALSLPSFGMGSPAAMKEFRADAVQGTPQDPLFAGSYGKAHPVGTGPFVLDRWTPGAPLVLGRNNHYWGDEPDLQRVVLTPIAGRGDRRRALQTGAIDAYDGEDPTAAMVLGQAGYQVIKRPSMNVGYLGFNQGIPPLGNLKIRQAIAHAVDRRSLVAAEYGPGAVVAQEFMPPSLPGYSDDVPTYAYDPALAKRLVEGSGTKHPRLTLWYPTKASWPYLPDPAATSRVIAADLEAAGFTVTTKPAPWASKFINAVQTGRAQLFLDGWRGDVPDPDSFLGALFAGDQPQWGLSAEGDLSGRISAASEQTSPEVREHDYAAANDAVMKQLPGLPLVHTTTDVVLSSTVRGFAADPTGVDSLASVSIAQ